MYYIIRWTDTDEPEWFCSYICAESSTGNPDLVEEVEIPNINHDNHTHILDEHYSPSDARCRCGNPLWKAQPGDKS